MDRHWTFHLPQELLCRIFYLSLSESPFTLLRHDQIGNPVLSLNLQKMITPFTLGAVCRYWRHVVWKEPNLWNSVYLVASPCKAAIQATLLEQWLSRTGQLPLSIDVDCSDVVHKRWSSRHERESMDLLEPIFKRSMRFTSFRTRLPPQCLLLPAKDDRIPDPRFENLTTLEVVPLVVTEGMEDDDEDLDIALFQHSQRLRRLFIREISVEQIDIPWPSLSLATIITQNLTLDDCLALARNAPNVEVCQFENIGYPEMSKLDNFPVLHLSRLHTLFLDFSPISLRYEIFFRHITAPNLKTLYFVSEEGRQFPVDEFRQLLQRSGCTLAHLEITDSYMTAPEVQHCLDPSAQSLEFVRINIRTLDGDEVTLSHQPILTKFFPKMKSAMFSAPASIMNALFSPPTQPHQ
ncbi:hypothetical protein AN958_01199 [Leucoagaricus sp. SymC.cos]|nr:hypothetical protein AN958_01199 [Leucoagaricus sp. SymC.cos]